MVHSGAFSFTNSKVLFAIICRERYIITVFLAIDGDADMKTSSFYQSLKLIPSSQSVTTRASFTATVGMCYKPKIFLYELRMQAAL